MDREHRPTRPRRPTAEFMAVQEFGHLAAHKLAREDAMREIRHDLAATRVTESDPMLVRRIGGEQLRQRLGLALVRAGSKLLGPGAAEAPPAPAASPR